MLAFGRMMAVTRLATVAALIAVLCVVRAHGAPSAQKEPVNYKACKWTGANYLDVNRGGVVCRKDTYPFKVSSSPPECINGVWKNLPLCKSFDEIQAPKYYYLDRALFLWKPGTTLFYFMCKMGFHPKCLLPGGNCAGGEVFATYEKQNGLLTWTNLPKCLYTRCDWPDDQYIYHLPSAVMIVGDLQNLPPDPSGYNLIGANDNLICSSNTYPFQLSKYPPTCASGKWTNLPPCKRFSQIHFPKNYKKERAVIKWRGVRTTTYSFSCKEGYYPHCYMPGGGCAGGFHDRDLTYSNKTGNLTWTNLPWCITYRTKTYPGCRGVFLGWTPVDPLYGKPPCAPSSEIGEADLPCITNHMAKFPAWYSLIYWILPGPAKSNSTMKVFHPLTNKVLDVQVKETSRMLSFFCVI